MFEGAEDGPWETWAPVGAGLQAFSEDGPLPRA